MVFPIRVTVGSLQDKLGSVGEKNLLGDEDDVAGVDAEGSPDSPAPEAAGDMPAAEKGWLGNASAVEM